MSEPSSIFFHSPAELSQSKAIKLADRILHDEQQTLPVNIIIADNRMLADLNSRFRNKNGPTDVLSFAGDEQLGILGELYISVDKATVQAKEYNATFEEEILRLICHGVLHLCGYDHDNEQDKKVMKRREDKYLDHLN